MFKRRKPDGSPAEASPQLADDPDDAESPIENGDGLAAGRAAPRLVDTGLGVPPFHPAPPKETPSMGRMPFPAPNMTAVPAPPANGSQPSQAAARPGVPPGRPSRDEPERRTLVVGRGISVQGTVQDAERLVVEGTVEASMIHAAELSIAPGGVFKGEVEVEDAEIAGTIDGTLTVRGNLIVRATGKVLGTARCRRLQVEDGGQITGRIEMLTESAARAEAVPQAEAVA